MSSILEMVGQNLVSGLTKGWNTELKIRCSHFKTENVSVFESGCRVRTMGKAANSLGYGLSHVLEVMQASE